MCTCHGLCTILTGVRTVVQSRAAKSATATQRLRFNVCECFDDESLHFNICKFYTSCV